MNLIKWDPFRGMDRFFDDDWDILPMRKMGLGRIGWDLAADVYEDKAGNVVSEMNLPGIDPEKIDIIVKDNVLRVSGEREEEIEEKKKNYYRKEIRRGSFERMVRLPHRVNGDKANAEYKDGVLRVTVPKLKGGEEKKVKIKVMK